MTHQELLNKLAYTPHTDPNGERMHKALRAVVELHKPTIYEGKETDFCAAEKECWGCGEWGRSDKCQCDHYPCLTIQAIEKELS